MKPLPSYRGVGLAAIVIALAALTLGGLWYKGRPRAAPSARPEAGAMSSGGSFGPGGGPGPQGAELAAKGVRPASTALGSRRELKERGASATARPDGGRSPDWQRAADCTSNLQRLVRAISMYALDYDDRLPIAHRWCDATYPYVLSKKLYHCPAAPDVPGYAFNRNLSGARTRQARGDVVALFESSAKVLNATDTGQSLCDPPRHPAGNSIGYLSGYVSFSGPDGRPPLAWR